jgi:lipopolysaccharide heptosyltransferase I
MTRALVVRLGSLGDLVHTLPAVAAVRRSFPGAEIDWLVDGVHRPFLDLVPAVDSVVALGGRSASAWLAARRALRLRRYDVAIDFQGLIKSAVLARLSGAREVVGFERRALREPAAAVFYTRRVAADDRGHVIWKNLTLASAVGATSTTLEFPIGPVESSAVAEVRARVPGAFAIVNGGAAWPNKRWPAVRFGRLAAWLAERHALQSVVLWGPGEEALAGEIVAASHGAAVLAPLTSLADLVALARAARLFVSGDTGPTYVAAAVGTPVVALFGPTDPVRNGPWRAEDVTVSRYQSCDCHYARRCHRDPSEWCLAAIGEDEVRAAVDRRLAT